jgi:lysine 6-dehydrogenase
MKKIIVLGAGLVGLPMAKDLAKDSNFEVSLADINKDKLASVKDKKINTIREDLSSRELITSLVKPFDFVVNAVPGFMGFETLKRCIQAGKDTIDIAFYPEDVFDLADLAKEKGVRVICDIGVAPGMSNLLTGHAASKLDRVDNVEIYVGGLPKLRTKPWEYKAVFSPTDIIEEYTRPARIVRNGKIITVDPLTENELLEFGKVGTLEAFNSDGLRSLLFTIKAENMVEKTLRYPGYAEKIKLFNENGFFSNEKINISGNMVSPLDFTSKLLFDSWKLDNGEEDLTIMRIIVDGEAGGEKLRYTFDLYDEYCHDTGIHSMARTTGYTATTALRLLAENIYMETGITLGEKLGEHDSVVEFMLEGLRQRGVNYESKIDII